MCAPPPSFHYYALQMHDFCTFSDFREQSGCIEFGNGLCCRFVRHCVFPLGCDVGGWYLRRECERNKKRKKEKETRSRERYVGVGGWVYLRACAYMFLFSPQRTSEQRETVR